MTSQATGWVVKTVWKYVTASNFTSMLRSGCPAVGIGVNVGDKSGCSVGRPFGPNRYTCVDACVPLMVSVASSNSGKTMKKYLQLVRSNDSSAPSDGLLGPRLPFAVMSVTSVAVPTESGTT